MSVMGYIIKAVNSHVEIFDKQNQFIASADTEQEAIQDIRNGEL